MKSIGGIVLFALAFQLVMGPLAVFTGYDPMPLLGPVASTWWMYALMLVAGLAIGRYSLRLLHRSYIGRLVRGRGFTPAPEDK